MMKRYYILAAAPLMLSSITSASAHEGGAYKPTFYVGGAIGLTHMQSKFNADYSIPAAGADLIRNRSADLGKVGFMGDVRIGYEMPFSTVGLFGFEIFGGGMANSASSSSPLVAVTNPTNISDSVRLKERYSYGFAFKFGYIFQRSALYLKLGGRLSNWMFEATLNTPTVAPQTLSGQQRKTQFGFEPGIGFDMKMTDQWSVNGEFLYSFYPKKSFTGPGTNQVTYSYQPRSARFLVGFTYRFR